MQSPNLHHHQLQDSNNNHLRASSPNSCFGTDNILPRTSSSINLMSNYNYMNPFSSTNNGIIDDDDVCSRLQNDLSEYPPLISNSMGCSNVLGSSSSDSYPKFTDLLSQSSSSLISLGQDLNMMKNHDLYSHVFPTINTNLEGLDDQFSGGRLYGQDGNLSNYGFTQMQPQLSTHGCKPFNRSSKLLREPYSNNNGGVDPRTHSEPLQKKSRSASRDSCPPLKVRKEKLGDRIAALQQLVAPFGKTDTASVLMEAIGYIKFLQNQVQTLSVPYMKASPNKQVERARSQVSSFDQLLDKKEEQKRDLRSRGLCLVSSSCLSYVTYI